MDIPGLIKLLGNIKAESKVMHKTTQRKLAELGKSLGYSAIMEYRVENLRYDRRDGLIDVVWVSPNGIEAAFEIKIKNRNTLNDFSSRKDKFKLLGLKAKEKLMVNVAETTGVISIGELETILQNDLYDAQTNTNEKNVNDAYGTGKTRIELEKKAYDVSEIRKTFPRAYENWTEAEDTLLKEEYNKGAKISFLASFFQRRPGAIRSRLRKHGLID